MTSHRTKRRTTRRGTTLTELMIFMGLAMTALSVSSGLVHRTLGSYTALIHDHRVDHDIERFAAAIRRDMRTAQRWSSATAKPGAAASRVDAPLEDLILEFGEAQFVRFEWKNEELVRVRSSRGSMVAREYFRLPNQPYYRTDSTQRETNLLRVSIPWYEVMDSDPRGGILRSTTHEGQALVLELALLQTEPK